VKTFSVCLRRTITYLLLLSIVVSAGLMLAEHSFASSLEIIGTEKGLQVVPEEEQFFNINNLYPGKAETSPLRISNTGQREFMLFIEVEKKAGDDLLFHGVNISISQQGSNQTFYSGPISSLSSIKIGEIQAGTSENLAFTVSLKEDAGNEYQGKSLDLAWKFIAAWPDGDDSPPVSPDNGENPPEPPGEDNGEDGDIDSPPVPPDTGNGEDGGEEPAGADDGEDVDFELPPETPGVDLPRTGGYNFALLILGAFFLGTGFLLTRIRDKEEN